MKIYVICLKSGKRNICRKLSITNNGKSFVVFPKCCNGWVNLNPSACKQLILAKEKRIRKIFKWKEEEEKVIHVSWISSFETCCSNNESDWWSSIWWNKIRNGKPSSVNSSAFSNVISRTNGIHFSRDHVNNDSCSLTDPI